MEYFKPPDFFAESTEEELASAEVLQNFSDTDDDSGEPERFAPDILEEKSKRKKRKIDYSHFNSSEFNEVDTVLTNVEEYSNRIKEDVEKYARNVRNETDLFRSETELELANALIKRIEAERLAKEIVKGAEDTRDEVLSQGREEGFQAGYADGIKQQKEENEKNTGAVLIVLEELKNLRKSMMQKYEDQIVQLSLLISQKVVHKELTKEKNLVLNLLQSSMAHFDNMGQVKIRVNPVEFDFITEHQNDLKSYLDESQVISVRADQGVSPSGPVIESDFSAVDLDLNKQFKEIEGRLKDCVDDRRILFT
jgi:flagellar assembly protein FliH